MDPNLYFALPEHYNPLTSTLDFDQWVRKFQTCAQANGWNDAEQLKHLPPLLHGDAWIIYDDLANNEKDTFAHMVANLSKKLNQATQMQCSEKLHRRCFDPSGESLLAYQNDLKRLAKRAYPDMTDEQMKPMVLTAFIRGLKGHSFSLARKIRNANPKSLQDAVQKAQFILSDPFLSEETEQEVSAQIMANAEFLHSGPATSALPVSTTTTSNGSPSTVEDERPPSWLPEIVNAIRAVAQSCDYCGRNGHVEEKCFKKRRDQGRSRSRSPTRSNFYRDDYPRTMGAICTYCVKRNHTEDQWKLEGHDEAHTATSSPRPSLLAVTIQPGLKGLHTNTPDSCIVDISVSACGSTLVLKALLDTGSSISIIDGSTLSRLPANQTVDVSDTLNCLTAAKSPLYTLGSTVLNFTLAGTELTSKFYVAASPMITPMILGRDILTKANITLRFQNVTSTTSRVGETPNGVALVHTDWRALPSGWLQDEIVLSNNKLHIVTAKRDEVGGSSQRRFFVGVNPALIKPPSRAEQLGSLRLHKNLRNAGAEEIAAAERSFRRWREEGRLQHGCLGTESSTTSWYVTGGSGRRYRPVFTFLHLNRHLRAAFGNDPFAQVLISMLVDKTRCYKYTVVNDLADAYMHLWLLPSNWHLFTVNTTPFSETPTIEEFHCLPYGPSFCPRILETCLQWLLQHNKAQIDDCGYELWSYMDDIVIFSDKPVVEPEAQLQRLCEGYDLYLKATKRQDILHGDTLLLGQKYISDGDYLSLAEEKLNSFKLRGPSDNATFADLLGTLGSLSESPAIPPWSLALKHAAQALVSRERAAQHATWSSSCPKRLIELIRTWHGLVSETPIDEFKVPRLLDFDEPLHIFTDAARHAGGYIIRQSGQDLIQRVHIFSTRESSLPIVCLEGLVLYRAFSAVHRLELCGRRQFPRLYFHVDNTA
ncbi:paraneoplastic Ma antigen, partial [Perkinsus chesapeaki]